MDRPPCYECEKRVVGCHAGCGEYASWKKQRQEVLDEIQRKKELELGYLRERSRKTEQIRMRRRGG